MSNSAKMTLEEKVVQTIKSDTLMALVGDEDAILELATRAVKEAITQARHIPKSYGGYDEIDSPAVAAARDAAKEIAAKVAAEMLDEPAIKAAIRGFIADALPALLIGAVQEQYRMVAKMEANDATMALRNVIVAGEIKSA